ncbi:hypothetical protein Leryth_002087 [Lithospermum erythrorhizon]|nr:hypothetical protein Leryth_002087 [Lithospermum erythrorhizon]
MKRQRSPSSSSSSSDSCTVKQNGEDDNHQQQPPSANDVPMHQSRAKRVRKKQQKPENSTRANNGNKRSSIYRVLVACMCTIEHLEFIGIDGQGDMKHICGTRAEKYSQEIVEMQKLSKEEYLASLRRLSSGFSRGVSKYRGVAR